MIKLKKILKESAWDRKFGEPLPTMEDYKKAHDNVTEEKPKITNDLFEELFGEKR